MPYKTLILLCFLLAACGGKQEVFYFNSNIEDVHVSVGSESCVTPCKIKVDAAYVIPVSIESGRAYGFDIKISTKYDVTVKNPLYYVPAPAVFISPFITSSSMSYSDNVTVLHYDINSYYVYFSGDGNYAVADIAAAEYVLENFQAMRAELYYADSPYIAAFEKHTGISKERLRGLYANATTAVELYDLVVSEQIRDIMADDISDRRKLNRISELLIYDRDALELIYKNNSLEAFIDILLRYLRDKQIPLNDM